jgi:hypothetical protein
MQRLVTILVLLTAFGCTAATTDSTGREAYLGVVAGTDLAVAAVVSDDRFVFYSCGGDVSYATHSFWLAADLDDGGMLTASKPGRSLQASFSGDALVGTLEVDGVVLPLQLQRAPDDDMSGLYDVFDDGCRTGVIVAPGDAAPVFQGTWCDGERFEQVTPATPIVIRAGMLQVSVPAMDERELWVAPVTP